MSSSVTRADVSSWQLREVTTNPISSSPRLRSTTAKRPDGEGGSGTGTVGRGVRGEGEGGAGSGRGRGGNKGTELNCWSDFLREWRDLCQSGLNRASPPRGLGWLMRPPEAQRIGVNPPFESVLDLDAGCLGGRVSIPSPSSSASCPASLLCLLHALSRK